MHFTYLLASNGKNREEVYDYELRCLTGILFSLEIWTLNTLHLFIRIQNYVFYDGLYHFNVHLLNKIVFHLLTILRLPVFMYDFVIVGSQNRLISQ